MNFRGEIFHRCSKQAAYANANILNIHSGFLAKVFLPVSLYFPENQARQCVSKWTFFSKCFIFFSADLYVDPAVYKFSTKSSVFRFKNSFARTFIIQAKIVDAIINGTSGSSLLFCDGCPKIVLIYKQKYSHKHPFQSCLK